MADLLDADFALAEKNTLYRCLDRLVAHKDELFKFLRRRWGELFGASFDVLLYDLTSTYFETDVERGPQDLRQFGYSRDKRGDCRQVVIALIVTPEGFPLSYEVMSGDTADSTTLSGFLDRIEQRYGRAKRIWVMDRGIPTEDSLAKMRSIGASYLVGTPKGRLTRLERSFLGEPWHAVREGVQVKRLATEEDVYVLAQSDARIDKERGMRSKRLRRYVRRLQALQAQTLTRDQLLMKLGAARHDAGRAGSAVRVSIAKDAATETTTTTASLEFKLDRDKLRQLRRREGRYLLRTNLGSDQPEQLWSFYVQLTEVEQAFKEIKHDLSIRPIFHRNDERIEAHIFVAFLAYCLQVTLKNKLHTISGGTTPREVIDKFKTLQMVDVVLPTTDGRQLLLPRYTQPEAEHRLLLDQLRLTLPKQPPPRISATQLSAYATTTL
jgi:transposase